MRPLALTDRRFGRRVVLARAPDRPGDADLFWQVRCDCGREDVVRGTQLVRGLGHECRRCARARMEPITRPLLEVLLLGAEHAVVSVRLIRTELGWTKRAAGSVLVVSVRRRYMRRPQRGAYELTARGFDLLRDLAEGRRVDRWGLRAEIVTALDGGRASGRRTLRSVA